jgi:hypothetical protein
MTLPDPRSLPSLNGRQEAFCRHYAAGWTAERAAERAGYSHRSAANQGYRLLRRPDVLARLSQLYAQLAGETQLGTTALCAKLEAIYRSAMNRGEYGAARSAVALQGRLAGGAPLPAASLAPGPAASVAAMMKKDEDFRLIRAETVSDQAVMPESA